MKLLTHNMLTSKCIRGVSVGYPLQINNIIRNLKLFTHNILTSKPKRDVQIGYPLRLKASDVRIADVDFNADFVSKIIPKVDWPVLYNAAESIGHSEDLPKETPEDYETNEDFLRKAHHALLEVEVIHGELICPESGRKFPINNGIPNMLLNEDEI